MRTLNKTVENKKMMSLELKGKNYVFIILARSHSFTIKTYCILLFYNRYTTLAEDVDEVMDSVFGRNEEEEDSETSSDECDESQNHTDLEVLQEEDNF